MLFDVPSTNHTTTRCGRFPLLIGVIVVMSASMLTACSAEEEPIENTAAHSSHAWQPAHLPLPISRRVGFGENLSTSPTSQPATSTAAPDDDDAASRPASEPVDSPAAVAPPAQEQAPVVQTPAPVAPTAPATPAYTPPPAQPAPQPAPHPAPKHTPKPAPQTPEKQGPVLKFPGSDIPDLRLVVP
ncbi:hypothetical protein [Corynebacterium casei]|uniref:hypothetical protein n=2 Tax=Corynebacterium casei TaxID=160386 RepID=UPI003F8F2F35